MSLDTIDLMRIRLELLERLSAEYHKVVAKKYEAKKAGIDVEVFRYLGMQEHNLDVRTIVMEVISEVIARKNRCAP